MLLELIRFMRGRISFEFKGGYPERLIGRCRQSGVPLWKIRPLPGGGFSAETSLAAEKRLRQEAARAGTTVTIRRKSGVPMLAKRYRMRVGVFAGLAVLLLLPCLLGSLLWQVDISGNETIPTAELETMLSELGVHRGAVRSKIDTRHVERMLVTTDNRLSWVGVNLLGSTAFVEVRERALPPGMVDKEIPHNIVAKKGGHITEINVYEGQPTVRLGDSVQEGEIIVSGIMENGKQENRTVHARASVIAEVEDSLVTIVPYERTVYGYRGLVCHRTLRLFGKELPLDAEAIPKPPYKLEQSSRPIPLVGDWLGVNVTTSRYLLLEEAKESLSPDEAREEAKRELDARERMEFPEGSVLEREVTGQELEDEFILFADYLRLADIAEEREILLGAG